MARLNLLEETRFEKLPVTVFANEDIASKKVARRIADLILLKQSKGESTPHHRWPGIILHVFGDTTLPLQSANVETVIVLLN